MNIGAGNSILSEDMYKEGYKNITNIDFSEIVVDDMQTKYKNEQYDSSLSCRQWIYSRCARRCKKYERTEHWVESSYKANGDFENKGH